MIKILFVCHGNICRSPMAEFIFKNICEARHVSRGFIIESAATSYEEIGNSIYPPAKKILRKYNIPFGERRARRITKEDYSCFDYIVGMDRYNIRNMLNYWGGDPDAKIHLLMDYTGDSRDVSDPWYTDDFETAFDDINRGCLAMFESIVKD